jgi:hypothetical protein
MTPDELCAAYREQLRRLYGDEIADRSRVSHARGWYYISKAKMWPDGSIGACQVANAFRKNRVLEKLKTLRAREPRIERR